MASQPDHRIASVIACILILVLVTAPLLLGGHSPLAWSINATLIGFATTAFSGWHIVRRQPLPVPHSWLGGAFIALILVAFWIYLQSASWTPHFMHHRAWDSAARALNHEYRGAISLNPSETRLALLRLVTTAAVFWLALQLGRDPKWAYRVLYSIAISAAAYAVYGIFVEAYQLNSVLWREKMSVSSNVVTATFVGPNSFAIYAILGLLTTLGLGFRALSANRKTTSGLVGSRAIAAKSYYYTRTLLAYGTLVAPLLMAIVMSGSRAGLFFLIAIVFTITFLGRMASNSRSTRKLMTANHSFAIAVLLCCALLVAVLNYGNFVVTSIQSLDGRELAQGQFLAERRAVWWISIRALLDSPLVGFGYGAFADTFAAYRDGSISIYGRWMKAHNAYVEAAVGLGVPMALIFFYSVFVPAYRVAIGAITRRRHRVVPSIATAACLAIGAHQLIDFSIYPQGIAIVFAAILGVGTAQSWSSRKQ